jgi:hypothetical protein
MTGILAFEAAASGSRTVAWKPGPSQAVGVMYQFHHVALGVFHPQRVLHQLDPVAVWVLYIGGVSAAIRPDGGRGIGNTPCVQIGDHVIPIVNLERKMTRWGGIRGIRRMNFPAPDLQLELPFVEFGTTIEELGTEYLLIPLPGSLAVTDGDIDMLDEGNPGHPMSSSGINV